MELKEKQRNTDYDFPPLYTNKFVGAENDNTFLSKYFDAQHDVAGCPKWKFKFNYNNSQY